MRINVTGNAGSGKSTLSRRLARDLELPLVHLDATVWQTRWRKAPPDARRRRELALIKPERWIIDGVSARVRAAADLVILLDVPPLLCGLRGLVRTAKHMRHQRPELPLDCPEWLILPRLPNIIWRFRTGAGAAISSEAALEPHRFRVFRHPTSYSEVIQQCFHRNGETRVGASA